MNRTRYFIKKHSGTILTVLGSVGVVTTTVLAVKATPKAMILIAEAEIVKGEKLTPLETVKVAWKPYIPVALSGVTTIACILGINKLSVKQQASLMSAYALLDNSYKEYKSKVTEIYGEEADSKIKTSIAESHLDENIEVEDEKVLFFDFHSMKHFTSTMHHVLQAECAFLEILHTKGFATLNEYYALLGLAPLRTGGDLGWFDMEQIDPYHCEELEFVYDETMTKSGVKMITIDTNLPPSSDYIL